jgi:hypothetical protein
MRKVLAVLLVLAGALTLVVPAMSRTSNTAQWCAAVIKINTQYGTMKNKRYLPQDKVTQKQRVAVYEAALKQKGKLLSITPKSIKTAQQHELTFFANLKANHWSPTTPLAPMTIADIHKLSAFQRTQCGIKGI